MPGDYFWQCVDALAATFDDNPKTAEENLAIFEQHCRSWPEEKQKEVRHKLVQIIGGLARLQTRLADHDG